LSRSSDGPLRILLSQEVTIVHSAEEFFTHLATRVSDEIAHVVDALAVGMALGIPNRAILRLIAELTNRGWIEPLPRSPFGTLLVRLTRVGHDPLGRDTGG
jgi:hypothetical protein